MKYTNDEMRKDSGAVNSDDTLVKFLYVILRDHMQSSELKTIMDRVPDGSAEFTGGYIAEYAKNLASRLK